MEAVNNLIQAPSDSFDSTQSGSSASASIVRSLEKQVSHSLSQGGNFSAVTPSLAVKALNLPAQSLNGGVAFATIYSKSGNSKLSEDEVLVLNEKE